MALLVRKTWQRGGHFSNAIGPLLDFDYVITLEDEVCGHHGTVINAFILC